MRVVRAGAHLAAWAPVHDEDGSDDPVTDPAAAAVDQLQKAALEAVRAARAMLDAAESVLEDPAALDSVVRTMTTMARSAGETVAGFAATATAAARGASPDDGDDEAGEGFERIRVD